jgi:predicted NBD/HSP70 family sugar kinase
VQLISRASIFQLERRLEAKRINPSSIWQTPARWDDFGFHLDEWIEDAAAALAFASVAALAVIDTAAIVIDGAMPAEVRARLVERVSVHIERLDRRGLNAVAVVPGVIGPDARAIGGAALPLIKNFARDREVLFKETPNGVP